MRPLALAVAVLAVLAGCGPVGPTYNDPGPPKLAVGTILATPRLDDGQGNAVQAPIVAANVFYGQRDPLVVPTTPPTGIPDVPVIEHVFDDVANTLHDVRLNDQQDGYYVADSSTSPGLGPYDSQAEYRTEIDDDPKVPGILDAKQVPAAETPMNLPATQPAGVDLDVQRTGTDVAFVSVFQLGSGGATETWTNRPRTALDVLDTVADPTTYQASSFTVPGTQAFPGPGAYDVVLYTVTREIPGMGLDAGSGIWVGAGAAVSLKVQ